MEDNKTVEQQTVQKTDYTSRIIENVFSALSLITLGIVFLLNTTNTVSWSMWQYVLIIFLSIWPIFLILAGIQIIFKRITIADILGRTIGYIAFLIVILLSINATQNPTLAQQIRDRSWATGFLKTNSNNKVETLTITKDKYSDLNTREFNAKLIAGKFKLNEGGDDYLRLQAKYSEDFGKPKLTDSKDGNNLNIRFEQEGRKDGIFFNQIFDSPEYDFTFGQTELETNINLEMTAGDGEIKFSDLRIKNFNTKMTAGNLVIDLQNKSLPENIELEITAGDLELRLPKDTGLEIEYEKTAGDLEVNGENLNNGDKKYSSNTNAEKKIKLKIKITAGDVKIN